MTAIATPDRFDMGRVISRLLRVLGDNFVAFAMLAVVLVGLPTAALTLAELGLGSPITALTEPLGDLLQNIVTPARLVMALAAILVSAAGNAVLQGAVIYGTVSYLMGGRP